MNGVYHEKWLVLEISLEPCISRFCLINIFYNNFVVNHKVKHIFIFR